MDSVFKKMILVPEQNYTRHGASNDYLSDLDQQMKKILESQQPQDIKLKLYNDVLQKRIQAAMFNTPEPLVAPPEKQEEEEEDFPKEILVKSIPKTQRDNAKNFLDFLDRHRNIISYNNKGEITFNGKTIEHSNVTDLIDFALRRSATRPIGLSEFRSALNQMNVPKTLIKNKRFLTQTGRALSRRKKKTVFHLSRKKKKTVRLTRKKKKNTCILPRKKLKPQKIKWLSY
jgi:hypothetical protein